MRKGLLLLSFIFFVVAHIYAKPGDTTIVNICKNVDVTHSGNYDYKELLPDTSKHYRKVWLEYTIGRYYCAGSPQYCGSWDYNTEVFVLPQSGLDTVELAHVITPYATTQSTVPYFDSTWHWNYMMDITDFAPLLHDSVTMRYNYGAGTFGFTIGLKLYFIEGTPPREAIVVKKAWTGDFAYGNINNPIDNHLTNMPFVMPGNAVQAALRTKITGHGNDTMYGCSEFCSRYFKVTLDSVQVDSTQLWRTDCGTNSLYPQTGTWLFQRGGWCPGASVIPTFHTLPNLSPGDSFNIGLHIQPFVNPYKSTGANYFINTQVIYYGKTNYTLDASLEGVKAPSNQSENFRYNPICSQPVVTIRNTASTQLTSLNINYGIVGDTMQNYQWTGHLDFLNQIDVVLPPLVHYATLKPGGMFMATISAPNGGQDGNAQNNIITSRMDSIAQKWAPDMQFIFRTNAATSQYGNYNETSYQITTSDDSVIYSRTKLNNNHTYRDTFHFKPGCYKFVVTDDGCDGINWWYYSYYTVNPGVGSFNIHTLNPNHPVTPDKLFNGDFGCGFTTDFIVPGPTAYPASTNPVIHTPFIRLLNVPADKSCIIQSTEDLANVYLQIYDASGRSILRNNIGMLNSIYEINTQELPNGLYFVCVQNQDVYKTFKLIVQH